MTQDEIICMAREAGFHIEKWSYGESVSVYESGKTIDITNELKEFAVLVAAKLFTYDQVKAHIQAAVLAEREACAKVCMKQQYDLKTRQTFAAAIRARGEK
jgi:hypothetical protein